MDKSTKVILRADGNSQIGLGHVHRLLALSQILKPDFHCIFLTKVALPGIRKLILEDCHELIELGDMPADIELDTLKNLSDSREIFVVDGYHFGTDYQKNLKDQGHALVCIDDIQSYHFVADAIINPAGGVNEEYYSKEDYTQLFTGPRYAFLKKTFLNAIKKERVDNAESILICMGGADPENFTLSTLKECIGLPFERYYVIIGEAYSQRETLQLEAKKMSENVEVLINLQPSILADIMSLCSTAICSASGIAYEFLSIGGELYLKKTAANQTLLYDFLLESGMAYSFEQFRISPEKVTSSIGLQKKTFDGRSGERILKIFYKVDLDLHVVIRRAKDSDIMTLFHWANDPVLRTQSYNPSSITLEDHSSWFNKKLNDTTCHLYIFEYKNIPVAQVRFDVKEEATISYSLDNAFRGRGWGAHILQKAMNSFRLEYKRQIKIIGYVKVENVSSNRIFQNLGFVQYETTDYPNSYKYEYIGL